ncbi:MAG: SprT-like domain-containing protein [Deltaproteobacteria bacterium]|nr:SprT-like domain-containing protein [Deltaproteobacteria bacterium]
MATVLNAVMSLRAPKGPLRGERSNPVTLKRLHFFLQKILGAPVRLTITDNTHVFLNAVFRKKMWYVRLHWMFPEAGLKIWKHVGHYILKHDRASSKEIDKYIEKKWHRVRHPLPPIETKGKVYDLAKMFQRLNRIYFKGQLKVLITWGKSATRRSYEQLQMGSYSTSRNLITLHPNLDQKFVPPFVVEATLFHEMCHAVLPVRTVNGRKQIHPPAFKKLEERYPPLAKARDWEEVNLARLFKKPK